MEFLLNISANLFSSLLFLFVVLFFLKPKIEIAPFICQYQSSYINEGIVCAIKFVNRSLFSAYDVHIEISQLQRISVPPSGSMNTRYTPIQLKMSHISHIHAFRPKWWRREAKHAIIVRTGEDLNRILQDDHNSIQVQITLRHGLTGLSKVYKQEYNVTNQIIQGKYSYGTKFSLMH